jgi:hypothetical protein
MHQNKVAQQDAECVVEGPVEAIIAQYSICVSQTIVPRVFESVDYSWSV